MMRALRRGIAAILLSVGACSPGDVNGGGSPPPPPPPPPTQVDHVLLEPDAVQLILGDTRQLQARVYSTAGAVIISASITFSTTNATVAEVSAGGLVTSVAAGTAKIVAASGGKSDTTSVTVTFVPAANVLVSIPRELLKVSDTLRATATVRDAQDRVLNRPVTWTSSRPEFALISPVTGLVLGVHAGGPVTLTATVEGKSASAVIAVIPATVQSVHILPDSVLVAPGDSVQFIAEVRDEFGFLVEDAEVIWVSIGANIASISPTGKVHGLETGAAQIIATSGGVSDNAVVVVSNVAHEKFRVQVNNHLRYPVLVTQNDVIIGSADANSVAIIERPLGASVRLGWSLMRPNELGEPMNEEFPVLLNPTGTVNMDVDNVLRDGSVYFTPEVRNVSPSKVLLHFPVVSLATECFCFSTAQDLAPREYGYWLLTPQTTMQLFRSTDLGMTGPKLVIPVPIADVDPITGRWSYTILVGP